MGLNNFFALLPFAIVASITPGPNNILAMSCAVNHGAAAALPYQIGAGLACFIIMAIFFILGNSVAEILPAALFAAKYAGCAYMLWLAWLILRQKNGPCESSRKAATLISGFVLQFVNPKYYLYVITLAAGLANSAMSLMDMTMAALAFAIIAVAGMLVWAVGGRALQSLFFRRRRLINAVLAIALCWSAVSLVLI